MPRALLFGYDGVLVDRSGLREEMIVRVLQEEGIRAAGRGPVPERPRAPYQSWLVGYLERAGLGADPALAVRLRARASASYRAELGAAGPRWLPGAVELVELAFGTGLPLALVAEAPSDEVGRALAGAGFEASFKVVVTEADLAEPANRLSGCRLALAMLNSRPPLPERLMHPHEVAAVVGTGEALRDAVEAGLVSIWLGPPFEGMPEADFRAESPAEVDPDWLGAG